MEIFVNNAYYSTNSLEWIELVLHDENTLKNKYVTLTFDECVQFCEECKSRGFFTEPLLTGQFSLHEGVRKSFIRDKNSISKSHIEEKSIDCVYSLYWDLAEYKAIYLTSEDTYEDGYVGYVTTFSKLRVSSSTMAILVSYYDNNEQRWSSRYLIKENGERIEQQEFYCAIPKEHCSHFYKYGLSKIKTITINNKEFIIFKYVRNLSIYRIDNNQQFPESLIVHYVLKSVKYKAIMDVLRYAINDIRTELNIAKPELPVSNEPFRRSNLFNNKVGVFFKSTFQKTNSSTVATLYNLAYTLYTKLQSSGQEYNNSIQSCRMLLSKYNIPAYNDFALFYLLEAFRGSNGKSLELIDVLQDTLDNASLLHLEVCMYLYSIRLNTYLNPSVLDYRDGESLFYISSPEGAVNVEVWSWK